MSTAQMTDNKSPQIIVGGSDIHIEQNNGNTSHRHRRDVGTTLLASDGRQSREPEVVNEFSFHSHHRHQEQKSEKQQNEIHKLIDTKNERDVGVQVVNLVVSDGDQNETIITAKIKNDKSVGNRPNCNNNTTTANNKYFRAPQQFAQKKKKWNKQFKSRQKTHQQINKADMENIQNLKNQTNHRKQQQHTLKNLKQNFNKMNAHRTAPFSVRSKFFLPDKRPRKEIIIPPTKFLLGGNISDPLNLNSLQDEALNATTPTPTPKQSPITTPPKVEVIIPPNINDPLHLLDPVDSVEYEKQLVSPMKRKSKSKHRHRKKKAKRKRLDDSVSSTMTCASFVSVTSRASTATVLTSIPEEITETPPVSSIENCGVSSSTSTSTSNTNVTVVNTETTSGCAVSSSSSVSRIENISGAIGGEKQNQIAIIPAEDEEKIIDGANNSSSVCSTITNNGNILVCGAAAGNINFVEKENEETSAPKSQTTVSSTSSTLAARRSVDREKVARDLRLDLGVAIDYQQNQQQQQHQLQIQQINSGGGRKRRVSEGPNAAKAKFRRMDSMDKIVSPVVPQPGAWKRPPRTVPTGARKGSRIHSTSISESELISPTDETKTIESESVRGDTPDVENFKLEEAKNITKNDNSVNNQRLPKFKPEDAKYQHGNYDRYSGYRNLNEFMDVRLKVFQRHSHLFRDKDVLDIGCNVGHMTIAVAKNLAPKSILGIDIDSNLIQRARKNLSLYVKVPKDEDTVSKDKSSLSNPKINSNNTEQAAVIRPSATAKTTKKKIAAKKNFQNSKPKADKARCDFFPISFPICYGGINDINLKNDGKDESPASTTSKDSKNEFPSNIHFRTSNYVLKDESYLNNDSQQYDLIMCLSVTKWIHLNFGDAGLKLAFKRMFNQLRPGGKLILEAQNWASYKKKKNLTETIYQNYRNIEFFPNKFHEYLLGNDVGFSHSYPLGVPRHLSKGFCRPIQLYAKGDFTPNHIRWSDNYHPQTPYESYRGIYAGLTRPQHRIWSYDTPHHSGQYSSCRQTPLYPGLSTSQYYNPLETDSYLPSYDTEVPNRHYCFASPLYQTVWSPPASLRNSSSHTPVYGSVRESDMEEGATTSRHVYPPTDYGSSPHTNSGPFSSIRESDPEENNQQSQQRQHVYANCDTISPPKVESIETSPVANRNRNQDHIENNDE